MSTPTLKNPEGWEDRAPDGWDWSVLWVAVETGDHVFTDDFVKKAIDADIDPRTILDDGLFRASTCRAIGSRNRSSSSPRC